jgi:hypothetical protein
MGACSGRGSPCVLGIPPIVCYFKPSLSWLDIYIYIYWYILWLVWNQSTLAALPPPTSAASHLLWPHLQKSQVPAAISDCSKASQAKMVQEPLALSCKTKRQHGRPRPKPNGRSTTIPPSHSRAILSLGAKVKVKHGLWWNVCWCKRRSSGFMWWLQRDGFTLPKIQC